MEDYKINEVCQYVCRFQLPEIFFEIMGSYTKSTLQIQIALIAVILCFIRYSLHGLLDEHSLEQRIENANFMITFRSPRHKPQRNIYTSRIYKLIILYEFSLNYEDKVSFKFATFLPEGVVGTGRRNLPKVPEVTGTCI